GEARPNPLRCLHPVHPGHAGVDERDVGAGQLLFDQRQQLEPVRSLADDLDVPFHLQELPDALPAEGVVVRDDDFDPHVLLHRPAGRAAERGGPLASVTGLPGPDSRPPTWWNDGEAGPGSRPGKRWLPRSPKEDGWRARSSVT